MPLGFGTLSSAPIGASADTSAPAVQPVVTGVTVNPATATLIGGGAQFYDATVEGTDNPSQAVTWETTLGSMTSGGLLTAPVAAAEEQAGTVTAASTLDPNVKGTATFTVPAAIVVVDPPEDPPTPDDAPRYARPARDVSKGAWQASSGANLYAALDESLLDLTDYMTASTAATCEIGLGPVADPGTSSGQVVRYEAHAPDGGNLTVTLKQGSAVIASRYHAALPVLATVHELVLTPEQCDSITDYRDLRVEFAVT